MRIGAIKAYLLKEFKELIRSRLIILIYLVPAMILLLFGYGIRLEVKHTRLVVVDEDRSTLSMKLLQNFTHSQYFQILYTTTSYQEALHKIKQAKADVILIIPADFEKNLFHTHKASLAIFIDGAFPLRAMTMQGYVEGALINAMEDFAQKYNIAMHHIAIVQRNLFNQAMRDENAIVPGLIGLVLLVAPALLAALLIVKEKEYGTIFNFYSSPLTKSEFLIAKLLPVFLLHSVNIFILFLWSTYLFAVPFRGSFWLYWLSSEIYILISLSIGLLVSIITNRQIVAVVLTLIITIIPGFLYSGILMPISSMQGESYIEAHLFPIMYYNQIAYDTFLIGQGLASQKNLLYLGILILYSITLLTLGSLLMKKGVR